MEFEQCERDNTPQKINYRVNVILSFIGYRCAFVRIIFLLHIVADIRMRRERTCNDMTLEYHRLTKLEFSMNFIFIEIVHVADDQR